MKVQDIKIINIDGVPYPVDSMSETSQQLVNIYNDWSHKEADVRNELMIIQAAKETISRRIINQVRSENSEEQPQDDTEENVNLTPPDNEHTTPE